MIGYDFGGDDLRGVYELGGLGECELPNWTYIISDGVAKESIVKLQLLHPHRSTPIALW